MGAGSPGAVVLNLYSLPGEENVEGGVVVGKAQAGRWPQGTAQLPHSRPPRMLRNNRISCIHNDSFTGLRNVRLLSLYDNQIATISPGAFDTLQALSTL